MGGQHGRCIWHHNAQQIPDNATKGATENFIYFDLYILTMGYQIVQARMWAQGLTIGVLIAAGVMTHARRAKEIDEGPIRHIVSRLHSPVL